MITIDTSDLERAIRIARMTAKCDCQEKGGDIKNHFATILCDSNDRMIEEVAELVKVLGSMVSVIDVIWYEQGFTKDPNQCVTNYSKAKELLNKHDN
ncbi:hypothetical protein NVP1086O_39 [Vibrio phage 1.086.O._10N.222.51.F8]|nr:hypothetical protein NVP1086O_39 [Vibrio phage 1.086.O._10N.222.51.F8]